MGALPLIGLTLDSEEPGGYSSQPWYALRQNYFACVRRAGGLAVALPHESGDVAAYLERLDGLVVTGGAFDVDPALFGAAERHQTVVLKQRRTEFELAVCRIVGVDELQVNSAHHQAVDRVAPGLIVDAVAPDGVIEGIEDPGQRFCLGVQWHPEYTVCEGDARIFDAFVAAAAG